MKPIVDVLLIEDDPDVARLIHHTLREAGLTSEVAMDGGSGWRSIVEHRPKVVLSDWELPSLDGIALCNRIRESPELLTTFFVMVSSRDDPVQRERALDSGVDDYLVKPVDRSHLLARVRVGMRMWEFNERLRKAAITDGLTGLYNHDYLNTIIERELNRARRYGGQLALIMLDLDHFKAVNDTYGHLAGNATLVEVSRALTNNVRDIDTVGRFGGEEFAVVAPETSIEDALAMCERIRHSISDALRVEALGDHSITASLGVATSDDIRVRSAADLVDLADRALYAAKRAGRNIVFPSTQLCDDDPSNTSIEHQEVESLRKRVAILSVQAKQVYVQTIASLLQALQEKDPFTARHAVNVAAYSEQIAKTMGLSDSLSNTVRNAGLLHDIGKVGVPDRILMKPGTLTDIERAIMRQVPAISVRIIDHLRILESEMHIIRHQGEHFDGTGHPDKLCGEQIPIGSRVVMVANAFDAITTDRVYRSCQSVEQAMEEIRRFSNCQFDPQVVAALDIHVRQQRDRIQKTIDETLASVHLPAEIY